jgi:hypothetical protein
MKESQGFSAADSPQPPAGGMSPMQSQDDSTDDAGALGSAVVVRPEPNALVRSAKGYAIEARSRGTRAAYSKHWAAVCHVVCRARLLRAASSAADGRFVSH